MSAIHLKVLGAGKPIVLVHGWAMHGDIWGDFAQRLAQQYRVICVDLPGHGYSQRIQPFELAQISQLLVDAVDEPICCWLGWSLGAAVVLDIAQRFPQRVQSIILLAGTPHFIKTADWPGMALPVLESFAENLRKDCQGTLLRFLSLQINTDLPEQKALLKQLRAAVVARPAPDESTLLGGLQILKTVDFRLILPKLTVPIAVILGDRDTLVPVAVAEKMLAMTGLLEVTVLKKAGHVPFLSHTTEVLTAINQFMEQA